MKERSPIMKKLLHLALDVDDKAFHGCGIYTKGGKEKMIEFKTKPSIGALMQKLGNFRKNGFDLKVCYEATYIAFSLARELKKREIHCDVIAPSSIPTRADKTAKTDKIDCRDLVEFYRHGLLTIVNVPEESTEQIRDIIRSRSFIAAQHKSIKRHILSTCRRVGIDYRSSVSYKNPSYFTHNHIQWLETEINKSSSEELQFNLKMLLSQMRQFETQIASYDREIEKIANRVEFKEKVKSLRCYRGIDTLSAMCFINELGDIKRFRRPRKLTSYAGLDLREYSSGGKERRYSISKMGNSRIRLTAVEACQSAHRQLAISRSLKNRRMDIDAKYIEVADRCMKRLHKKAVRLLYAGKPINKIKTACAREMLCFVWESLNLAVAA